MVLRGPTTRSCDDDDNDGRDDDNDGQRDC